MTSTWCLTLTPFGAGQPSIKQMFTRDDVAKEFELAMTAESYLLQRLRKYVRFDQFAFRSYESEQSLLISTIDKRPEENGCLFWAASHRIDDWSGREDCYFPYLCDAQFELVAEKKFNALVSERCQELLFPIELPLRRSKPWSKSQFIGALILRNEWHTVDLFAEYEDEYLHFYWETTA